MSGSSSSSASSSSRLSVSSSSESVGGGVGALAEGSRTVAGILEMTCRALLDLMEQKGL